MSNPISPIYARVICPIHGIVGLTEREHDEQLARPGDTWNCTVCGASAAFDDEDFLSRHGHLLADDASDGGPAF